MYTATENHTAGAMACLLIRVFFLQKSFDKSIMVEVGKNSSTHLSKKLWFKVGGLFLPTLNKYIAGCFFF